MKELGERLYCKLTEIVIPQVKDAIQNLTYEDCIEYIYNLTINRTYDGFITEKSVVHDNLAKHFPDVIFEESDPELDHAGDIDYIGKIEGKAFGLQIKPVTANASLGNYDVSARMEQSFRNFEEQFGGKVFIVYSINDKIENKEVYQKIEIEIKRLKNKFL